MRSRWAAALAPVLVLVAGCGSGGGADGPAPAEGTASASTASPTALDSSAASDLGARAEELASRQATASPSTAAPTDPTTTATPRPRDVESVVAISIDGLRSAAISADATPALHRLLARGVGTRNARTAVERTETLPNHVCMVTGRRIAGPSGHRVTWNTDTDQRVRDGVASVFSVVAAAGGASAVVAGKAKLDLFADSWPAAVDDHRHQPDAAAAADAVVAGLRDGRSLTFWHIAGPDEAGHAGGWGSADYRGAVVRADAAVGRLLDAVTADPDLAGRVGIVLTSDHGGVVGTTGHGAAGRRANHTVPFVAWGPGVAAGDLYGRNPDRADPGTRRTSYAGTQPVRNCDLANVATTMLGLRDVPGSEFAGLRLAE